MAWFTSKTALSIGAAALVTFATFVVYRWRNSEYPAQTTIDEYSRIEAEYERLLGGTPSVAEWEGFESSVQARLDPIVRDLESQLLSDRKGIRLLYQLGKYDIPQAVRGRGEWNVNRMATAHRLLIVEPKALEMQLPGSHLRVDLIVVTVVLVNLVLVVWVVRLNTRWHRQARLRGIDDNILRHPESFALRGKRAQLRAALRQTEGAISDIDWLLDKAPAGVDLVKFRRLRESLVRSSKSLLKA